MNVIPAKAGIQVLSISIRMPNLGPCLRRDDVITYRPPTGTHSFCSIPVTASAGAGRPR